MKTFETPQERNNELKKELTAQVENAKATRETLDKWETVLSLANYPKRTTVWSQNEQENFEIVESLRATFHTVAYLFGKSGNPKLIDVMNQLRVIHLQKTGYVDNDLILETTGLLSKAQKREIQAKKVSNVIIAEQATDAMDLFHTSYEAYKRDKVEKNTKTEFAKACSAVRCEVYANGDKGRKKVKTNTPQTITTTITDKDGKITITTEQQPIYKTVARWHTVSIENINENNGNPTPIVENETVYRKQPYIMPQQLPENIELREQQKQAIQDIKKALTKTQLQIFLAMQDLTKTRTKARTMDNKQIAKTAKVVNSNCSEKELLAGAEKVRYNRNIVNNKARSIIQSDIKELFTFYISGENNNKNNNVYAPVKITPIKIPTDYTPNNSNIKLAPTTYTTLYRNELPTEQLPTINYTLELLPFIESNVINIPKNYKSMNERKKA